MDMNGIMFKIVILVMFFYGSVDFVVFYGIVVYYYCDMDVIGWFMFFGLYLIYECYCDIGVDVELYFFCGGGYGFVGVYFYKDQEWVVDFISWVLDGVYF